MVSKSDLKIIERYELLGETRYRICVKGTNLVVNIGADSDEEALGKALEVLSKIGLSDESLEKIRRMSNLASKCTD